MNRIRPLLGLGLVAFLSGCASSGVGLRPWWGGSSGRDARSEPERSVVGDPSPKAIDPFTPDPRPAGLNLSRFFRGLNRPDSPTVRNAVAPAADHPAPVQTAKFTRPIQDRETLTSAEIPVAQTRAPKPPLLPVGVVAEIDADAAPPRSKPNPTEGPRVAAREPSRPSASAYGRSVRLLPPVPGPRDIETRQARVEENAASEANDRDRRADLVPAEPVARAGKPRRVTHPESEANRADDSLQVFDALPERPRGGADGADGPPSLVDRQAAHASRDVADRDQAKPPGPGNSELAGRPRLPLMRADRDGLMPSLPPAQFPTTYYSRGSQPPTRPADHSHVLDPEDARLDARGPDRVRPADHSHVLDPNGWRPWRPKLLRKLWNSDSQPTAGQ